MAAGLLFMGGYGAILEVLQWAMEADRYFEVPDIVANIIGILLSYGINFLIYKMCWLWKWHFQVQPSLCCWPYLWRSSSA